MIATLKKANYGRLQRQKKQKKATTRALIKNINKRIKEKND
jgi:hypothetical protein